MPRGAQFAIYPLELVRTRLAVCPPGTYSGMIDCFGRIIKQEGWRAFYRGLMPSLVRPSPKGVTLACALHHVVRAVRGAVSDRLGL